MPAHIVKSDVVRSSLFGANVGWRKASINNKNCNHRAFRCSCHAVEGLCVCGVYLWERSLHP